jgi:hypothetical protein
MFASSGMQHYLRMVPFEDVGEQSRIADITDYQIMGDARVPIEIQCQRMHPRFSNIQQQKVFDRKARDGACKR